MTVGATIAEPIDTHGWRRRRRSANGSPTFCGSSAWIRSTFRATRTSSRAANASASVSRVLSRRARIHRVRRADQRPRRVDPGAGAQSADRPARAARPDVPVHRPRPLGRQAHQRSGCRHVPGQDRRDRPARRHVRPPGPPLHAGLLSAVPVPDPQSERRRKRVVLQGDVPSPVNPPDGCRFHTRCWLYERLGKPEECRTIDPPCTTGADHGAACHFAAKALETDVGIAHIEDAPVRRARRSRPRLYPPAGWRIDAEEKTVAIEETVLAEALGVTTYSRPRKQRARRRRCRWHRSRRRPGRDDATPTTPALINPRRRAPRPMPAASIAAAAPGPRKWHARWSPGRVRRRRGR